MNLLNFALNEHNKIDISSNKKALRRLKIEYEKVKKDLSLMNQSEIDVLRKDILIKIIRDSFFEFIIIFI